MMFLLGMRKKNNLLQIGKFIFVAFLRSKTFGRHKKNRPAFRYIFLLRGAKIATPTQKGCRCNRG